MPPLAPPPSIEPFDPDDEVPELVAFEPLALLDDDDVLANELDDDDDELAPGTR